MNENIDQTSELNDEVNPKNENQENIIQENVEPMNLERESVSVSEPVPQRIPPTQPIPEPEVQHNQQQNNYQRSGIDNYMYNTGYNTTYREEEVDNSPLSMGEWILTILASILPCFVGIGIYFYWAFSKTGNVNRRNYCRAFLIISGISILLSFIFMMFFGIAFMNSII